MIDAVTAGYTALLDTGSAGSALRPAGQGRGALSRAQAASLAAFKGGVVSLVEVLDADRRLLETCDGEVQACAAASRGAIASFRALGGG